MTKIIAVGLLVLLTVLPASAVELAREEAIGAQFGMVGPRVCSELDQPQEGPPTAEDARKLFICYSEGVFGTGYLGLVSNVQIEVASHGRAYDPISDAVTEGIDPNRPVYDIRGSFTYYSCNPVGYRNVPIEETCRSGIQSKAQGVCSQNTFGDWSCIMVDKAHDPVQDGKSAPPTEE